MRYDIVNGIAMRENLHIGMLSEGKALFREAKGGADICLLWLLVSAKIRSANTTLSHLSIISCASWPNVVNWSHALPTLAKRLKNAGGNAPSAGK
jgi:hypothetical protein